MGRWDNATKRLCYPAKVAEPSRKLCDQFKVTVGMRRGAEQPTRMAQERPHEFMVGLEIQFRNKGRTPRQADECPGELLIS